MHYCRRKSVAPFFEIFLCLQSDSLDYIFQYDPAYMHNGDFNSVSSVPKTRLFYPSAQIISCAPLTIKRPNSLISFLYL